MQHHTQQRATRFMRILNVSDVKEDTVLTRYAMFIMLKFHCNQYSNKYIVT